MVSPSHKPYHFSLYFLLFRAGLSIHSFSCFAFRFSSFLLTQSDSSSTAVLEWLPRLMLPMPHRHFTVHSSPTSPFFSHPIILSPLFLFCPCFFPLSTFAHLIPALLLSLPFYFYAFYSLSSAFFLFSLSSFVLFSFSASLTGCFPSARSRPILFLVSKFALCSDS